MVILTLFPSGIAAKPSTVRTTPAGTTPKRASGWSRRARRPIAARRLELYRRFQEKFAEELPALMLYYPVYDYVISSRVRNVQVAPIVHPSDRFRNLHEWLVDLRRVPGS
jgi:hypothetical protein